MWYKGKKDKSVGHHTDFVISTQLISQDLPYSLEVFRYDQLSSSLLKIPICLLNAMVVLAVFDIYDVPI